MFEPRWGLFFCALLIPLTKTPVVSYLAIFILLSRLLTLIGWTEEAFLQAEASLSKDLLLRSRPDRTLSLAETGFEVRSTGLEGEGNLRESDMVETSSKMVLL